MFYLPAQVFIFHWGTVRDSDEDGNSEKTANVELPFQEESHFKKFDIQFRKGESKEDFKQAITCLKKEALFLNLIPIAFNEER